MFVIDASVVSDARWRPRRVSAPKPATRRGVEDGGSNLPTANEPSDGGSFFSSPRSTPSLPLDASPHAHTAPALSHASACAFPTETAVTFVFGANPRIGAGACFISKTSRKQSTAPGSPQLQSRPVRSSTLNPQPAPMASFASGLCARRKMARHEVAPKGTPRDARVPRLGSPTSRGRCARAHPWDASSARPGRHSAISAAARSRGSSAPRAEATTTASRSASAMVSWGGEDTIACAAECPHESTFLTRGPMQICTGRSTKRSKSAGCCSARSATASTPRDTRSHAPLDRRSTMSDSAPAETPVRP